VILALDTATLTASVALLDGARVVAERRARVTTHSETLLGLVREVLSDGGVVPQGATALRPHAGAIDAIACGAGPGSFTGLRIGLATAKGLCAGLDKPLVLVSSLEALALRAPVGVLAVGGIDAFKGEVYAGFFRREASETAPTCPAASPAEAVLAPDRLAALLAAEVARGPVHLVGDVLDAWPILAVPGVAGGDRRPPDAVEVGRLAALRVARGEHDDLGSAVPRYIRPSEAELHQLRK
jgi:tRNA threonylcarbamoyladenosine biosynthesis protein TsaB